MNCPASIRNQLTIFIEINVYVVCTGFFGCQTAGIVHFSGIVLRKQQPIVLIKPEHPIIRIGSECPIPSCLYKEFSIMFHRKGTDVF